MLQCGPDRAPSLPMGHTGDSSNIKRKRKRKQLLTSTNVSLSPLDLYDHRSDLNKSASLDDSSHTDDSLQMDYADPTYNTKEDDQGCRLCSCSNAELKRLLEENRMLKKRLSQNKLNEDFFKDDDEKVKYYTGLPCFLVLMGVLKHLRPFLSQTSQKLSPFQILLSTLMRLKLNLPIRHIAFRFSVDQKTMSRIFRDTIGVMFKYFKPLVHWPEKRCLPHQFKEAFGNRVAAIVDCFEINIEGAISLKTETETLSHHKHKDTLKYLIGFTPLGAISFISQGWGGRVSDKHVAENSGLFNKLVPGDLVLAVRGFDIKDSGRLMSAEVKSPAATVESNQLDVQHVETQQNTQFKEYLERMTERVRTKYAILRENIPVSMVIPCQDEDVSFFEKMLTVCCALTNMCPRVVGISLTMP